MFERIVIAFVLIASSCVFAQSSSDALRGVSHSSSLTFMKRDRTCVYGPIAKVNAQAITVQQYNAKPITIQRADLLQVSQGDALLFTVLSSWSSVMKAHVLPHEAFILTMRNSKTVKGRPAKITSDSITLKHGLTTTTYMKNEVATVDYLCLKPESDNLDYFAQEAPFLLFFDPGFYYRLAGLEGRIPVRLYDSSRPESIAAPKCLQTNRDFSQGSVKW